MVNLARHNRFIDAFLAVVVFRTDLLLNAIVANLFDLTQSFLLNNNAGLLR